MNIWKRKLTNKQKRRKWAKTRGIFFCCDPSGGRGRGCWVRVLRKVTRIMIEGFLRGFQISHCGIFEGKKIWKVPFLGVGWGGGGGRGTMPWDLRTFLRGGEAWLKTIWKLVLRGTSCVYHLELQWVVLSDKVQPRLSYLHANFPVICHFYFFFPIN